MKGTQILLCLPAMLAMGLPRITPAAEGRYDPPDFDRSIFEMDGLSMAPEAREETVEALAALARNFASDPRVDNDLKEKALAIALRLDPFNPRAREAHSTLSEGIAPGKTDLFESLTAISEALWQQALKLTGSTAEPDDTLLGSYLMELSLLAHPDPSPDRLRNFASVARATPPAWKDIATLQPEQNDSSVRSATLARGPKPAPPQPAPSAASPAGNAPEATADGEDEIRLPQTEIGFIACDTAGTAAAGIARLTIRNTVPADAPPSGALPLENLPLKLAPDRNGPPFRGSEIIESTVRKRFPVLAAKPSR